MNHNFCSNVNFYILKYYSPSCTHFSKFPFIHFDSRSPRILAQFYFKHTVRQPSKLSLGRSEVQYRLRKRSVFPQYWSWMYLWIVRSPIGVKDIGRSVVTVLVGPRVTKFAARVMLEADLGRGSGGTNDNDSNPRVIEVLVEGLWLWDYDV